MIFNYPTNVEPINECFKNRKDFQRPTISTHQNSEEYKSLLSFKNYMNITDKFAHNFLYCRFPSEGLTVSESKVLANQRVKYLNFIKQTFKYKIPEQFLQKNIMIQRHRQYRKKIKQERMKKQIDDEQIKGKKRSRVIKQKQGGSKKKVKGKQQKVEEKDIKKQSKKKKVEKKQEDDVQNVEQQLMEEYSNDFENGQDDHFESEEQNSVQDLIDG